MAWKAAGEIQANGNRRIQVSAGDVADRGYHGKYDQTKGEGDTDVGHCTAAVDYDGGRPSENKAESSESFSGKLLVESIRHASMSYLG
jgi:hypothetical protein